MKSKNSFTSGHELLTILIVNFFTKLSEIRTYGAEKKYHISVFKKL